MRDMPQEITSKEKMEEIIGLTISQNGECRTIRAKDHIKIKFRTKSTLYTMKLPLKEAEALIKDLSSKLTVVSL